jgi:Domain of unknown function (DUF4139)/N-terminal domain of unknown function (DUF4140)
MGNATASLPITQVVVLEDRAQVERRGQVTLGGLTRLEVPGLPLVAVDRSLQVEVQGGTFVDARLERRWRERPPGGLPTDASALRRQVDALRDEVAAQGDLVVREQNRGEVLQAAREDLLRAVAESAGHGKADVATWSDQLEQLSERQDAAGEALRVTQAELARLERRLGEARAALTASEAREEDLECALHLTLEGSGPASVRVRYLVPCAVWRPAYRAQLAGAEVRVQAEALVWQATGEAWTDVALRFSTARPTLGTTPPRLVEDRLRIRPKAQEEKKVVDVAVREEIIQTTGECGGGEPELPGLDDGGEARLLEAPGRTTVPSDGQPHRVPLFDFSAPAALEQVCPGELTPVASLVARFPNASGQVLLAGPVDLVRQAGFVGRSLLPFAAPGETVKLSFGSIDGLQVVRATDEKVDESRMTGRRTTTRTVTLHVSNARPEAATLVLEERLPVSEVKEVEVQVLAAQCSPPPASVSPHGIARLELSLPPHGTRTARFVWELSAAAKVAGV